MKPFMLKLRQGKDEAARDIFVNMNRVSYIAPNGDYGSILVFGDVTTQDEPSYLVVNETPDQIGARPEWSQP